MQFHSFYCRCHGEADINILILHSEFCRFCKDGTRQKPRACIKLICKLKLPAPIANICQYQYANTGVGAQPMCELAFQLLLVQSLVENAKDE